MGEQHDSPPEPPTSKRPFASSMSCLLLFSRWGAGWVSGMDVRPCFQRDVGEQHIYTEYVGSDPCLRRCCHPDRRRIGQSLSSPGSQRCSLTGGAAITAVVAVVSCETGQGTGLGTRSRRARGGSPHRSSGGDRTRYQGLAGPPSCCLKNCNRDRVAGQV